MKIVPGRGNKNATILFLGEAPGFDELQTGRPFTGPSGKLLCNQILAANGILESEVYIDNVIQTTPKNGRNPTDDEVSRQLVDLRRRINNLTNLHVIVAVGSVALKATTVFRKTSVEKWRGSVIRSNLTGHKVIPIYHPAFSLRGNYETVHISITDVARAKKEAGFTEIRRPKRSHHILYEIEDALSRLRDLRHRDKFAFDVETSLGCLGFAPSVTESFTIPFESYERPLLRSEHDRNLLIGELVQVFNHDKKIITQNGLFDMEVLWKDYGISPDQWHIHSDTMSKHGLLYPELPHSLAFITSTHTDEPFYKDEGRKWRKGRDPEEDFFRYNGKDCCVTLEADEAMEEELEETGQKEFFYQVLMPLLPVLFSMKRRGLLVSLENLEAVKKILHRQETIARIKLIQTTGYEPNPRSPLEMEQFLTSIGIKERDLVRSEKTRKVKTDEDYLRRLFQKTNRRELLQVLALRTALTLQSGFTNLRLDSDGRYHVSFKLGPKSGRLASSSEGLGPQLQNIPVQPTNMRSVFVAPASYRFVEVDLSQADARVLAYAAPEPLLIKLFESSDPDIHAQTCSIIFGIPRESIDKDTPERYLAKRIVHATNYGMGPRKFCEVCRGDGIFLFEKQAKEYQEAYLNRFSHIRVYHNWVQSELRKSRTLVDLLGRKHLFLGMFDDATFREAYSRIPQATVAGVMAKGMITLHKLFEETRCKILVQVHDSLLIECPENHVEYAMHATYEALSIPLHAHGRTFTIPMEFKVGTTWGQLQKVNFHG